MSTIKDKIYKQISDKIKACDYQRRSIIEQMDQTLQARNIEGLAVLVYKYQNLSNKIDTLKKIMYDIESQITK